MPFGAPSDGKPRDDSVLELTTPAPVLPPLQPPPSRAHLQDQQKPWPPEDVPAVDRVVDRLRQSEAASAQARAASIAPAPEPAIPVPRLRNAEPAPSAETPAAAAATGGMTLDTLVREMLRPMLSAWIDTHMPAIVERLVKQEISGSTEEG